MVKDARWAQAVLLDQDMVLIGTITGDGVQAREPDGDTVRARAALPLGLAGARDMVTGLEVGRDQDMGMGRVAVELTEVGMGREVVVVVREQVEVRLSRTRRSRVDI